MSPHDPVFEPLLGKRRTVRQALIEVAERWTASPIEDPGARAALVDAVRHKLLRGEIDRELPQGIDAETLARDFVAGLVAGLGTLAVERVVGEGSGGSSS
ncbi:MAG TPA: hypothetical protein VLT82_16265 [Myxococcaceae bacterium]|nr:hypothetical protein [Myxococcaceae bacterium]